MEKVQKSAKASVAKVVDTKVATKEVKTIGTELFNSAAEIANDVKETSVEIKGVVAGTVNEIAEKVDFTESVEKIKESAKVINTQLKDSASEIASEVKEMSKELKEVATKGVKEISKKVETDVSANVEKIKTTAQKVNTQITENAEEFKKTATKLANDVVENLKISDKLNNLKDAVKNANNYALETTSELIDGVEANSLKWQGLTEKAIKTGLKLAENQQDLMFSTLEAVKTQIGSTSTRFKKLFSNK